MFLSDRTWGKKGCFNRSFHGMCKKLLLMVVRREVNPNWIVYTRRCRHEGMAGTHLTTIGLADTNVWESAMRSQQRASARRPSHGADRLDQTRHWTWPTLGHRGDLPGIMTRCRRRYTGVKRWRHTSLFSEMYSELQMWKTGPSVTDLGTQ